MSEEKKHNWAMWLLKLEMLLWAAFYLHRKHLLSPRAKLALSSELQGLMLGAVQTPVPSTPQEQQILELLPAPPGQILELSPPPPGQTLVPTPPGQSLELLPRWVHSPGALSHFSIHGEKSSWKRLLGFIAASHSTSPARQMRPREDIFSLILVCLLLFGF